MSLGALNYYPWQLAQAQRWLAAPTRFAHAWLIHGIPGIGKVQFAKAGAAALLCSQPAQGVACGHCVSCQWFVAGSHPDLRLIRPEAIEHAEQATTDNKSSSKASTQIRIEQLRALTDWFNTATHRGGYRVAVLYPAEQLNSVSANALLKILEEPPAHTVFLLVSHAYQRLLPTLLSRCRRLLLPTPDTDVALAWLSQQRLADGATLAKPGDWLSATGGAPVAALEAALHHEQPYPAWLAQLSDYLAQQQPLAILQLAPQLERMETVQWLDCLQRWYVDLQYCAQQLPPYYYPALAPQLQRIAQRIPAAKLQAQWQWLLQQKKHAYHPLNAKLLIHTALERVAHSSH